MTVLESRIDSVKVYHAGATVSRVVEVTADDGRVPQDVEINGLPLALLDSTVRIRIDHLEPADSELYASDLRVGLHAASRDAPEQEPLRAELEEIEKKLISTAQTLAQTRLEMVYLESMEVPSRPDGEEGKPPPASPMAARVALEQFTDEAIKSRVKLVRELRDTQEGLEKSADDLRDRIRRASTAREAKPHELTKAVISRLRQGDGDVRSARLVVEYFVPGARWAPAYQCRLTRDCRGATLQQRALICQRTGEDWRGVKLILSTASPMTWTELPELSSVRIGRAQPPKPEQRGFRPPPIGAVGLFSDYDRDRDLVRKDLPGAPGWSPPALVAAEPTVVPETGHVISRLQDRATIVGDEVRMRYEMGEARAEEASEGLFDSESTGEIVTSAPAAVAGPPPMQPLAAMAPPPAPRAMMSPADAPTPPAQQRARKAAKSSRARRSSAAPPPEESRAALEVLAFSQLRLASPQDSRNRSQLVPVERRTSYLEHLARSDVQVRGDVMKIVRHAQHSAAAISSARLPQGAFDVRHNAGYFDFCYKADAPIDVESDGTFHSIVLGSRTAESKVKYIVVPREDTSAYRMATLTNPLGSPLLPGPVEVHVGGEYVLTTILPSVAPGGRFLLGLGVEQALKIARNTSFRESRSGEKVVAMTELEHVIDVEVANNLGREVECEVRERIPQPNENAEVVVEELEVEPPWEVYTQAERKSEIQGGRRWRVTIKAESTTKLHAGYVVKIYANNELIGGNRREA